MLNFKDFKDFNNYFNSGFDNFAIEGLEELVLSVTNASFWAWMKGKGRRVSYSTIQS
jgi:hypothetical protein